MSDYNRENHHEEHHEAIAALRSRITERTLQAENAALRSRISELIVNLDNLPTERTLRAENAALRSRISVLEEALDDSEEAHQKGCLVRISVLEKTLRAIEDRARAALHGSYSRLDPIHEHGGRSFTEGMNSGQVVGKPNEPSVPSVPGEPYEDLGACN